MDNSNTEIIRGHVDTIILRVLEQRDRYGYEILELIDDASDGRYNIKQPTLYSCLKRLEKQGFISSYFGDETNGGRRRYYKLTEKGTATLTQDQREWEFSRSILDKLLSDKQIDLKTVEAPFEASELRPLTKRVKVYDLEENAENKPTQTVVTSDGARPIIIPITVSVPQQQTPAVVFEPSVQQPVAGTVATTPPAPTQAENLLFNPIVPQQSAQELSEEEKMAVLREEAAKQETFEKQTAAAMLLQIGDYAPYNQPNGAAPSLFQDLPTPKQQTSAPNNAMDELFKPKSIDEAFTEKTPRARIEDVIFSDRAVSNSKSDGDDYRQTLGNIFTESTHKGTKSATTTTSSAEKNDVYRFTDDSTLHTKQFEETRRALTDEGYKIKPYSAANSANYYYMNYVYSNRLMRDCTLLTYVVLIIEVLVLFLARSVFDYGTPALLVISLVGLLLPGIPTVRWAINPTRRTKAAFNFGTAFRNSFIAFILVIALATIINLVTPSISVYSGKFYVPYIIALDIPLSVTFYNVLYKSKNYHLKGNAI